MSKRIKPEQLGDEIGKILTEYSDDVVRELPDACKDAAKATVKALKANASNIGTGRYRSSFKSKKTAGDSSQTTYTVYSTRYRVAHLLERGHPIRNQPGGRVYGVSAARPHWAPAEEEGAEALEEAIRKAAEQ